MAYPIRILHVVNAMNRGGAESMIMNLYRTVDRSVIQFDFVLQSDIKGDFDDEIEHFGGKLYVCPKFKGINIFQYRHWWKMFFCEHKSYKILHSHIRSCASLYIPIAKKQGLKTIIHSHSTSNGKGIRSAVKKVLQYPLRYQADYFMCCSKEAGDWLFGKDSSLNEKYMFIPNAIDVSRFAYNEKIRKEYREQYGVEGKLVFGHVGRFHEAKNHLFLLDVFNEIHSRKSDAVLMLIGDGELRAAIEAGIHRLGIDRSVILTGVRSDVSNLMHAMDVFLFPSLWEGLPVTVVEAQAAGLPCLVSDNVTKDIDISKLVHKLPTDNVTEWADLALSALIRQDVSQEIKALGFDVEESANRLTAFYKRISEEYKSGEVYHSIG